MIYHPLDKPRIIRSHPVFSTMKEIKQHLIILNTFTRSITTWMLSPIVFESVDDLRRLAQVKMELLYVPFTSSHFIIVPEATRKISSPGYHNTYNYL